MALRDFFNENEAESFAKLRGGGWIDVSHPEKSKLLAFVNRQADDSKELIRAVRKQERTALTEWLVAAVAQPELLSQKSDTKLGLELDETLIRYLRSDQVLSRFNDSIWAEMGRCVNCHSPKKNERLVEEHVWTVQSGKETRIDSLANGNYVAKILVDHGHRMSADPQADFFGDRLVGIRQREWTMATRLVRADDCRPA